MQSSGKSPLIMAAENGHFEIIECLISHGVCLLKKDEGGKVALDYMKDPINDSKSLCEVTLVCDTQYSNTFIAFSDSCGSTG